MAMSPTCDRLMPDGVSRCKLLYAHGHNQWLKEEERRQRIMAEQFKVGVPMEARVAGWLYDHHSGLCMGIASDEMKKKTIAGIPFKMVLLGTAHTLVIHPVPPEKVVTDPSKLFHWTYTRSRGDIEVFAPNATEAARVIMETGLVKKFDAKKLAKTGGTLTDRLKKEGIK